MFIDITNNIVTADWMEAHITGWRQVALTPVAQETIQQLPWRAASLGLMCAADMQLCANVSSLNSTRLTFLTWAHLFVEKTCELSTASPRFEMQSWR